MSKVEDDIKVGEAVKAAQDDDGETVLKETAAVEEQTTASHGHEEAVPESAVLQAVQLLSADFQKLQQGFESKIKYDESKDRTIDSLHKELQEHRQNLHFKILRPIFAELISLYDDMEKILAGPAQEDWPRTLRGFMETVEDILYHHGVEVYSELGDSFVAQRQRALKTVETADPEKDKLIAERSRKGFAFEDRILRPELVHLYKFRSPPATDETAE